MLGPPAVTGSRAGGSECVGIRLCRGGESPRPRSHALLEPSGHRGCLQTRGVRAFAHAHGLSRTVHPAEAAQSRRRKGSFRRQHVAQLSTEAGLRVRPGAPASPSPVTLVSEVEGHPPGVQAGRGSPEYRPAACSCTSTCRPRRYAARLRARGRRRQCPHPPHLCATEHGKDSKWLTHRTHHGAGVGWGGRDLHVAGKVTTGPVFLA